MSISRDSVLTPAERALIVGAVDDALSYLGELQDREPSPEVAVTADKYRRLQERLVQESRASA